MESVSVLRNACYAVLAGVLTLSSWSWSLSQLECWCLVWIPCRPVSYLTITRSRGMSGAERSAVGPSRGAEFQRSTTKQPLGPSMPCSFSWHFICFIALWTNRSPPCQSVPSSQLVTFQLQFHWPHPEIVLLLFDFFTFSSRKAKK